MGYSIEYDGIITIAPPLPKPYQFFIHVFNKNFEEIESNIRERWASLEHEIVTLSLTWKMPTEHIWQVSECGTKLFTLDSDHAYDGHAHLEELIEQFLKPNGFRVNGIVNWLSESDGSHYTSVKNNEVTLHRGFHPSRKIFEYPDIKIYADRGNELKEIMLDQPLRLRCVQYNNEREKIDFQFHVLDENQTSVYELIYELIGEDPVLVYSAKIMDFSKLIKVSNKYDPNSYGSDSRLDDVYQREHYQWIDVDDPFLDTLKNQVSDNWLIALKELENNTNFNYVEWKQRMLEKNYSFGWTQSIRE